MTKTSETITTAWTAPNLADMDLIDANGNPATAYDPRTATSEKFEALLGMEQLVRLERASEAMAPRPDARERARTNRKVTQAKLFAALEALTPEEQAAYGKYRV